MAIFTVIQQPGTNSEKLGTAVTTTFHGECFTLSPTVWLVSSDGVAREVSDQLGITKGENGSAIVTEVASYFGRANPEIWSWMKAKLEGPAVG